MERILIQNVTKDNRAGRLHLTTTNEMKPEDRFGSSYIICLYCNLKDRNPRHMWTNDSKGPFFEAYFAQLSLKSAHQPIIEETASEVKRNTSRLILED